MNHTTATSGYAHTYYPVVIRKTTVELELNQVLSSEEFLQRNAQLVKLLNNNGWVIKNMEVEVN